MGWYMSITKVYAEKVYRPANIVLDEKVYLGEINAIGLTDAFVKAIRLYNKNARRSIVRPFFKWRDNTYMCTEYDEVNSRGVHRLWTLNVLDVRTDKFTKPYICGIPKSKVNNKNWIDYLEYREL